MSESKCTSWLGHKFKARYSYGEPRPLHDQELYWLPYSHTADVMLGMRAETYEGDVCVRCGCVVNRHTNETK